MPALSWRRGRRKALPTGRAPKSWSSGSCSPPYRCDCLALGDHPVDAGVVLVEPVPGGHGVARLDRIDDRGMVAPGPHRIGIVEVDEVGRLVEGEPEDLEQAQQHLVVLA